MDCFTSRMKRHIKTAYEENKKIAERTNQQVTMTVDDDGNITKSMKNKVIEDLPLREVKPTAPPSAELSAAGAKGGMVNVTQCIERTNVKTGEQTTDLYEAQDLNYSKF